MVENDRVLEVAIAAAQRAGEVLRHYWQNGVEMRQKQAQGGLSYDLVSDADIHAEQAVAEVIQQEFPDHTLLGEEALQGATNAEHLWIIDPLDGTNNFAHRIPHFAVSIGYCYRGEYQVGVIYNPIQEDWYTAVAGRGAFANGKRVAVDSAERLDQIIVGTGFYYDRGAMMHATLAAIAELFTAHIHGMRRFGAASLDLVAVGCGQFGGFFEYKLSPWDFAAGAVFVREAGGMITTAQGEPLPIASSGVLASNGKLHADLLEIVGRHATTF